MSSTTVRRFPSLVLFVPAALVGLLSAAPARALSAGGFPFWFAGDGPATNHHQALQPVRVVVHEWKETLPGGQVVRRTLKVFNDSRSADPIDVAWSFRVGGKLYAEGAESFGLEPGTAREFTISFRTPEVPRRTPAELVLTCGRNGEELFRDVKRCFVLGPMPPPPRPRAPSTWSRAAGYGISLVLAIASRHSCKTYAPGASSSGG